MEETSTSQIRPIAEKRHYVFGNLPVHTTSFVLALLLTVLWSGVFISEIRNNGITVEQFLFFTFIMTCLLLLVYGNRSNRIIFYFPMIYLLRPLLLAITIYGIFQLHEYNTPNTFISLGVLRILICCGALYITNIFAADTLYIAEAANQPALPSFSIHFDNLKNRLSTNIP